jgi:PLP dependent protein
MADFLTPVGPTPDPALQTRIIDFCQQIPRSVRLIAVSKTLPASTIRVAYAAGLRDFGESKVQEAAAKQAELADLPDITWHLIGRLQSNKAQKALELFDWIQSVDSLALAQRLDRLAADRAVQGDASPPQICLQVKLRDDPGKTGWSRSDLLHDFPALQQLGHLRLRGLMVIPPYGSAETPQIFQEAKALLAQLQADDSGAEFDQLSMGMSDDYALAIQSGATMIRPGRALFGERPTPPPAA